MYDEVVSRLLQLGYVATVEDDDLISFQIDKTTNYVKSACNISEIPEALIPSTVDVICGEILFYKYSTGQLVDSGFNFDMVAKSIKVGDTQVQYDLATGDITPTSAFLNALKELRKSYDKSLGYYRRLKW